MKIKLPVRIGLVRLSLIAVVVGLITGFGAVLFRALIGLIHNVAFLGKFAVAYDANVFTPPSPWGALVILVPVSGGMLVTFLVTNFAPEARGHGVPEVMDAIYYKDGIIRPVVAVIKSLASALSIGTGAAVGREGPIIQIGAALGSTLGQIISMAPWQRITLVAAGAGAGIAATFNTPIGGVMFAIELMMPEVSARTFLPVALATGTATFIGRIFLRLAARPSMCRRSATLPTHPARVCTALLYAVLGALIGRGCDGIHSWPALRRRRHSSRSSNPYLRHAIGMLQSRRADLRAAAHLPAIIMSKASAMRRFRISCRAALPSAPFLVPLFVCKASRHIAQPRFGIVRRNFFTVAVHGRNARRRFWRACSTSVFRRLRSASPPSRWSAWPRWSAAAPGRR